MSKKMPPRIRKAIVELLTNRWAIGCFAIMGIQQIIEASSTYWLVTLTDAITSGHNFVPFLILYFASILIPYIPGCIGLIWKTNWKQMSQRSFINNFVNSNKNNISEWSNKGQKEEKLSILTNEGPAALNALIDYSWDLYTYVLSVLFNIMALAVVVEPLFAISFGVSIACVAIVMKLKRRMQRQLTQKALIARVDLCQSLLAAWDNVLLGNDYNFKLWNERTSQRMNRCLQRNMDLERFDQILAISVSLITSIPSLIVVGFSMLQHQGDVVKLTSYVVILPLLFMILSYTYQTLSLMFRWGMHRSKMMTIFSAMEPRFETPAYMEKKIKWAKIMASYSTVAPADHISLPSTRSPSPLAMESHVDLLKQTSQTGRLTIRGDNGSGKSTALMLLKNALAGRAFFLPTHNQLSFVSETNKYSTGESLRNRLLEILDRVDVDVLLLDEWDANLDKENQERLSALIDELSEKKCVVEVRHRS